MRTARPDGPPRGRPLFPPSLLDLPDAERPRVPRLGGPFPGGNPLTQESLAAARAYVAAGFSVIPNKPKGKEPAISKWKQYQKRRPAISELSDWFAETDNNVGLVMGAVSGNAFALDFDDPHLVRFAFDIPKLAQETFVQETAKGVHVVFRIEGEPVKSHNYRDLGLPLDIKGEGGQIVAAPSVHESGAVYRKLSPDVRVGIIERKALDAQLARLAEEWPIVQAVLPHYSEGRRHDIALSLAAWLRRRGFPPDRAGRFMQGLARAAGDAEGENRARAVEDTFAKAETQISVSSLGADILSALDRITPWASEPGVAGQAEAQEALGHHVRFSQPWHYDLMLLWAAQTHLRAVLPDECCVNLAFTGPKSSGKSKATEIAVLLAEGEMLGGGTLAAMIRTFDKAGAVGIDELDSNVKRLDDLEGVLRIGNKWSAVYKICIPTEGGGQKLYDLRVGGPKVFNYRSDIEDALKSRTYILEMPQQNDSKLVVSNLFLHNPTNRLTAWLKRVCGEAVRNWTKEKVEAHMKDAAFIARLDALPAALARNRETAAIFLLIADILGWDIDDEMRKAAQVQADEETSNDDIRELLVSFYGEKADPFGSDLELPQADVLTWVNAKRKGIDPAARPLGRSFARVRREFGFREGVNFKKRSDESGKRFLTFDADVRKALGIGPIPAPRSPPGEGLLVVHEILRELTANGKNADHTAVVRLAETRGIALDRAISILERMRTNGDLYEPVLGSYRLTESLGP